MISLEEYTTLYPVMMAAAGNRTGEEHICAAQGITVQQWQEARDHFTACMMNPADGGKTAVAFSAAMTGVCTVQPDLLSVPAIPPPGSFHAERVEVYVSVYDVQMITWLGDNGYHVIVQRAFDNNEQATRYDRDTCHLSVNDQRRSIYGGLEKVVLYNNKVHFFFNTEGCARMGCPDLEIGFSIDRKKYNYLRRMMAFVLGHKLDVMPGKGPGTYAVNGLQLNDDQAYFEASSMKIHIRTGLQQLKESGLYPAVVFLDFRSETIGRDYSELELLLQLESVLTDILEHDLSSVLAFNTTHHEGRRFYIYTSLSQGDFTQRVNEALRLLPRMPLAFSGGEDKNWDNYTECLEDLAAQTTRKQS